MWVIGMNMFLRFVSALTLVATLVACGGGGGGGGSGGGDVGAETADFTSMMTADLSGSQRARPNATMGALEAQ